MHLALARGIIWAQMAVGADGLAGLSRHVHIRRDNEVAKFSLDPVRLERSGRMTKKEIGQIEKIIVRNQELLLRGWNEIFQE